MAPIRPHGDEHVTLSGILIAAWEYLQGEPSLRAGLHSMPPTFRMTAAMR
jgi:hypothetical protein